MRVGVMLVHGNIYRDEQSSLHINNIDDTFQNMPCLQYVY